MMEIKATVNVPIIVQAMCSQGWGKVETAARCKIAAGTLNTILDGKIPRRIDTLYRLSAGLGLSIQEILGQPAPRLRVVGGRDASAS